MRVDWGALFVKQAGPHANPYTPHRRPKRSKRCYQDPD